MGGGELFDDWHQIPNIVKVHMYGRDAAADGAHKQYLGLGVISCIDIKKAGKTELETFIIYWNGSKNTENWQWVRLIGFSPTILG